MIFFFCSHPACIVSVLAEALFFCGESSLLVDPSPWLQFLMGPSNAVPPLSLRPEVVTLPAVANPREFPHPFFIGFLNPATPL